MVVVIISVSLLSKARTACAGRRNRLQDPTHQVDFPQSFRLPGDAVKKQAAGGGSGSVE
jgi:hypothetical protein